MKQSSLGLSNTVKRTRKREFLDAMELVVPWTELVSLIEPYAPEAGRRGQQPFAVQTLLRIHFMQQWFKLIACWHSRGGVCGCLEYYGMTIEPPSAVTLSSATFIPTMPDPIQVLAVSKLSPLWSPQLRATYHVHC